LTITAISQGVKAERYGRALVTVSAMIRRSIVVPPRLAEAHAIVTEACERIEELESEVSPLTESEVQAIVREELRAVAPAPAPLLCTIPYASKVTGISVDTLRSWIASGRLPRRTKGAVLNSKRPTYLVCLDEIKAAAAGKKKY
jgi:hypothetical protein